MLVLRPARSPLWTWLALGIAAMLAVPIAAVQNDAQGEYVLVSQVNGAAQRVDVVSGAIQSDLVVVTGELQAGQSVLLSGSSGFSAPNPFAGR